MTSLALRKALELSPVLRGIRGSLAPLRASGEGRLLGSLGTVTSGCWSSVSAVDNHRVRLKQVLKNYTLKCMQEKALTYHFSQAVSLIINVSSP